MPGLEIDWTLQEIEYFHFIFDRHEIVTANGTFCESLYLGEMATCALGPEAQREIKLIFPGLTEAGLEPARTFVRGRRVGNLVRRQLKNQRSVFELSS